MKPNEIKINVTLKNNQLLAEIIPQHSIEFDSAMYYFYLIKEDTIIDKRGWYSDSVYRWTLEQHGTYQIQGYLKNGEEKYISVSKSVVFKKLGSSILGPIELKQAAEDASLYDESSSDSSFSLLDCSEMIRQLWPSIKGKYDGKRIVRGAVEEILGQCQGRVYWIFWELKDCPASNSVFYYLLEECYDVCRTDVKHDVREIKVPIERVELLNSPEEFISSFYRDDAISSALYETKVHYLCEDISKGTPAIRLTEDNRIVLESNLSNPLSNDRFAVYLLKDGTLIGKSNYSSDLNYSWPLNGSGTYYATLFVKRYGQIISKSTLPVFYADDALHETYENFLHSDAPMASPLKDSIPFFSERYPFFDFLVISNSNANQGFESIKGLELVEKTNNSRGGEIKVYSSTTHKLKTEGKTVLFSGKLFYERKYYYGPEELCVLPTPFAGQLGQYSCIEMSEDEIVFGTDFFAFNRWFYYDKDGFTVIANNYHLLLLALQKCGVPLHLRTDKSIVTLSTIEFQFLSQNFSRHMDIYDCEQVPFDKVLKLGRSGLVFEQSEIGKILSLHSPYHESEYAVYKKREADAMLSDFESIIRDERFREITVDLTGGMDSRIVFAMLTNASDATDRVKINTRDVPGSNDLLIAMGLNNLYHYQFNDFSEELEDIPIVQADAYNRHFYLGTYYSKNLLSGKKTQNGRLELTGACGEILYRPYVSRRLNRTVFQQLKQASEFTEAFFYRYAYLFVLDGNVVLRAYQEVTTEEFHGIPGDSFLEKLDRHYLGYRHAYHFDTISERMGFDHLMPLQSKGMLALHHYCYNAHNSIRLQIDMISQLNPYLMMIPFDSEDDNKDAKPFLDRKTHNLHVEINYDTSKWEEAEKKRKSRRRISLPNGHEDDYQNLSNLLKDGLMRHFHILMNLEPELSDSVGLALYHQFNIMGNNRKAISYWYNKITSLMDQALIAHGEGI